VRASPPGLVFGGEDGADLLRSNSALRVAKFGSKKLNVVSSFALNLRGAFEPLLRTRMSACRADAPTDAEPVFFDPSAYSTSTEPMNPSGVTGRRVSRDHSTRIT